jgi:signal transduction histidine kinase
VWASRGSRATAVAAAAGLDLLVWHGAVRTMTGSTISPWLPVVTTLAAHQSLWWLSRAPRLTLASQALFGSVSLVVPLWQPFAGLFLALHAGTARLGLRRIAGFLPAVLAVLLAHSHGSARLTAAPVSATLTVLALWGALTALVLASSIRQHRLVARTWVAVADARRHAETELVDERRRIARELHDGVGGAVTAVHLHAAAARASLGDLPVPGARRSRDLRSDQTAGSLAAIEAGAERSLVELRRLVAELLPTGTPPPNPGFPGTAAAPGSPGSPGAPDVGRRPPELLAEVDAWVRGTRDLGVEVHLVGDWSTEVLPLPEDPRAHAVLRTVHEALTNVVKHAGPGSSCTLELVPRDAAGCLVLTATSRAGRHTARGPAAADRPAGWSGGHGLTGLAERATLLGGRLTAAPVGPRIFVVRMSLPPSLVPVA